MRVFTVTGSDTAATTSVAIATIASGSRSQPAPAPRPAIFGTQQPQLMSMNAGLRGLGDLRRLGEALRDPRRRSGSRSAGRPAASVILRLRVAAAAEQALDVDELGDAELGAERAAEAAEDGVGDVLHRREDHRPAGGVETLEL